MRYAIKPLHCRPWTLNGLSPELIESHYESDYGGALRRLNAVTEQLESLDFTAAPPHLLSGLKREETSALNSVLLHELYFASLGGDGQPTPQAREILAKDFGSYDRWRAEFRAMGYALGGRSGWVVLSYLPREGRLVNQMCADDSQAIVGAVPILALDMHEHAYHMDFGANARAYVDTFFRNIDWSALVTRFERASATLPLPPREQPEFGDVPTISTEEVGAMLAKGNGAQVIDVRPRHIASRQREIVDGVEWRDPDQVQSWMRELSTEEPVVVYCAYGFHVGCKTAIALREAGYDARFMDAGHSGWRALGGTMKLMNDQLENR
jgi:Fe-Mn family superoxide dismutase